MRTFSASKLLGCLAAVAAMLPTAAAAEETILGVYIVSRHGDRSPKAIVPANYTTLGYNETLSTAEWYRDYYIAAGAPARIAGIEPDVAKPSQLDVWAPMGVVLMSSAHAFTQGLYPPVGRGRADVTLRNGSRIERPRDGYQIIPIYSTEEGAGSENKLWLVGASNCALAQTSSNDYSASAEYRDLLKRTQPLYDHIAPTVSHIFAPGEISYKNAFSIWDAIDGAVTHNHTIAADERLTPDVLFQLRTLADRHEFNLAYNASSEIRGIGGMTLAGYALDQLNKTIASKGKTKLGVRLHNYAAFLSFFGLSRLTRASPDFYGLPDFASTMTFELFTTVAVPVTPGGVPAAAFPRDDDIQVRMRFHNGSMARRVHTVPPAVPLFGQAATALPWPRFVTEMSRFAVRTDRDWCTKCRNVTGKCAEFAGAGSSSSSSSSGGAAAPADGSSSHRRPVIAGVIGAMVALATICGIGALVMLLGRFRLVRKNKLQQRGAGAGDVPHGTAKYAGSDVEKQSH